MYGKRFMPEIIEELLNIREEICKLNELYIIGLIVYGSKDQSKKLETELDLKLLIPI